MNKKLIALTLLAVLAEQGFAFAGEYVAAPTYSTYSNGNGECCPAPRPVCCKRKRVRRVRSCCPRVFRNRSCCRPAAWRRRRVSRPACRVKRACCPRARCCRPKAACCPAPAPVCAAPACVQGSVTTTCATTSSCAAPTYATESVAAPQFEYSEGLEPIVEGPMETAEFAEEETEL